MQYSLKIFQVFILLFLLAPITTVVLISLDPRDYIAGFPPYLSLRWFEYFINYDSFMKGLSTSLRVSGLTMVLSLLVGMLASIALTRYSFKGRDVLSNFFLSPLIIPAVVSGVALLTLFRRIGFTDSLFNLVIGHLIITLPYSIRSISTVLMGLDKTLEEAAKGLGASEFRTFLHITLPLIKPGIVASLIFSFAVSINDYAVSVFLSDVRNYMFSAALFAYLKAVFDPAIAVASTLLMSMTLLMVFIMDKVVGLERSVGLR
ncbi:MAG: ABC transporter permease [Candidatus Caldarchaeum sp.]|nr:ABC transporter permease [Candidatus Caldarchaeum sp.]